MASVKTNPFSLYLWYGLLLIGIAGCEGLFDLFEGQDKYYSLDDQYKIKFNQGDILNYTDQSGATFQLVITEIRYNTHTISRKGSSGPYNIYERQTVHYDTANITPSTTGGNIYTVQRDGHVSWEPGLYAGVGEGSPDYHEKITINSKVYYSVFRMKGDPRAPNFITTWYYSYAYGFVAFECNNGQVFTLDIP